MRNMTWQTLYMDEVLLPDLASDNTSRLTPYIYLKGIKLTTQFIVDNKDAIIHMAILQDRDNNNSDLDRRQNFFRDTTGVTARAHPFNDWAAGDPYDRRMTMNAINSDHYRVITHEKFILQSDETITTPTNKNYFRMRSKYYKINRRVAFDNTTETVNWRPFYIAMWWQPLDSDVYVPANGEGGVNVAYKTDVVYRNIV